MAETSKRRAPNRPTNRDGTKSTKSLANDVVSLGDRLGALEGSTSELSRQVEQLIRVVSTAINPGSTVQQPKITVNNKVRFVENKAESYTGTVPSYVSLCGLLNTDDSESLLEESGSEQCHTQSTISLFQHTREQVLHYLKNQQCQSAGSTTTKWPRSRNSPTSTSMSPCSSPPPIDIQRQDSLYPLPKPYQATNAKVAHKAVELPQRSLLEDVLDSYFDKASLETPIFTKAKLLGSIEEQYQLEASKVDESWALCFNCIILQSVGSKSKLVSHGSNSRSVSNDSLQASILETLKFVVLNPDAFAQHRLINVQALLLLALVARDYFHFSDFEKVFDQACHITKRMRLQEHSSVAQIPSSQESERRDLIWALYVVDKQRVFIKGPPCRVYLFECHISLPEGNRADTGQDLRLPYLLLNCLVEEIYTHLYSVRAKRQPSTLQQEITSRLLKELDAWWSRFRHMLELSADKDICKDYGISGQKLKYMFHVLQILVVRRGVGEINADLCLKNARAALENIHALCTGTGLLNGGLLLRDNSIVAYFEVFENLLRKDGPDRKEDLVLLTTVTNALGLLSHPNRADSYLNRLHKRLMWCTQIALAICNGLNLPNPARMPSPISTQSNRGVPSGRKTSAVENQQISWPLSMPHNGSASSILSVDNDMVIDSEDFTKQTGHMALSHSESSSFFNGFSTDLNSSGRNSFTDLPSMNDYPFMDTLPDTTMSSLCESDSVTAATYMPRATSLFFGDDLAFDEFYQNMGFPSHMENNDGTRMWLTMP